MRKITCVLILSILILNLSGCFSWFKRDVVVEEERSVYLNLRPPEPVNLAVPDFDVVTPENVEKKFEELVSRQNFSARYGRGSEACTNIA